MLSNHVVDRIALADVDPIIVHVENCLGSMDNYTMMLAKLGCTLNGRHECRKVTKLHNHQHGRFLSIWDSPSHKMLLHSVD